MYLYHWPIFLALTPARTHLAQVPLFGLRLAVTGAVAVASYRWLEQPIRRRKVLLDWKVFPAALGAAVTVVVVAAVVTVSIPPSTIAYADVSVTGHVATVEHLTSGSASGAAAPAAVAGPAPGERRGGAAGVDLHLDLSCRPGRCRPR